MNELEIYALAKQLTDRGFPYKDEKPRALTGYLRSDGVAIFFTFEPSWLPEDAVYVPSMPDLINACPKEYEGGRLNFTADDMGWAAGYVHPDNSFTVYGHGSSLRVAIMRLWLSLNPPVDNRA